VPSEQYRQPKLTVDIIIELAGKTVLIKRRNAPYGWAIPGGFLDYGETVEQAAIREAREETSLELAELHQFHVYSDPGRDPRGHTVSVVFTARGYLPRGLGTPRAGDDACELGLFDQNNLPAEIAFDHRGILEDYFNPGRLNTKPALERPDEILRFAQNDGSEGTPRRHRSKH
jgi:ADP-ribose pyrophosphatase YjhB (NUDIX family)